MPSRHAAVSPSVPTSPPSRGDASVPDPFAEIRHELGNYFHKLYFLAEQHAGTADDLTATLQRLEAFLALALEVARPLALSPVAMSVGDVVAGLAALAREGDGRTVAVTGPAAWDGARVAIDAAQLPAAFRGLVAATVRDGGALALDVAPGARDGRAGVELHLSPAAPPTDDAPADAIVRWAVAARVVASHGGVLRAAPGTPPAVVLFLPFHP
jgi:hypothetical protein